jgi:tight adherence protein C
MRYELFDPSFLKSVLAAVAVSAMFAMVGFFFASNDDYAKRRKSVLSEREKFRQGGRMQNGSQKALRQEANAYMKDVVERFSLSTWLNTEDARDRLAMAGYRGPQAEIAFLFFRAVSPIAFLIAAILYFYVLGDPDTEFMTEAGACVAALYAGIKAPELFLSNVTAKRQQSMRRAFPDALDLMLICVEAGMSIEAAFRKVGQEVGSQSIELAQEFALATAELSYLPDRRTVYNNFAARTGLAAAKQVVTVLIQAEKYGTPLGQALRVTAQESRDARLMEAEKAAAALPPKLTVPMIIFFLPVLMLVVLAPAAIQIVHMN